MIQRYSLCCSKPVLSKRFKVAVPSAYQTMYNAGPSSKLPVITNELPDRIQFYQWGIIPYDAQDSGVAEKLLNARKLTLKAKAPFCDLIAKKRCIIPADGFYIWKEVSGVRTPYRISLKNDEQFGIPGVWDEWKLETDGDVLFHTFSMITQEAAPLSHSINERMPVFLRQKDEYKWLSNNIDIDELLPLLEFSPIEELKMEKVSNLVDNEQNNIKKVIKPLNAPGVGDTMSLFD